MARFGLRLRSSVPLACVLSVVLPRLVAAQPEADAPSLPAEVSLLVVPCESAAYDSAALIELLRVELRSLGIRKLRVESESRSEPAPSGSLALIRLGCGSVPATLAIVLADMVGGNQVSRELLIDDVKPSNRARALSIAIASLLESSWSLLASRQLAASAGAGPVPMPESVRAALRRRLSANLLLQPSAAEPNELPPVLQAKEPPLPASPISLRASLGARAFPSRGSGLTGFDFAVAPAVAPRLALAIDLEAMYGRQLLRDAGDTALAELDTLWLSFGASLYFATRTKPDFLLGPMLRAAYARVLTATRDADFKASDADGWLMMVGLSSVLRFDLTPGWDLFFGLDIAYVPGGLNFLADTTRAVSFADLSLALRLGFSWNS